MMREFRKPCLVGRAHGTVFSMLFYCSKRPLTLTRDSAPLSDLLPCMSCKRVFSGKILRKLEVRLRQIEGDFGRRLKEEWREKVVTLRVE